MADAGGAVAISCATLAANPSLLNGEDLLLDLDGGPVCTLPDSTDLVLGGVGTRLVAQNGTLEVRGNIQLSGTSAFTVRTGTLRLDNQTNFERNITASDGASWILDHATLATNATGMNNVSATYTGSGTATAQFQSANLDSSSNWLLATNTGSASLYAGNSNVPNEIYLQDSADVQIADDQIADHPRSSNGVWLRFYDGNRATVMLPDESGPYSWQAGRGQPGYTNIDWLLQVTTANPGIGVETHAGSAVEIDGRGSVDKEVGFGIYIDPASGSAIAGALASTPFAFSNPPLNLVADLTDPLV